MEEEDLGVFKRLGANVELGFISECELKYLESLKGNKIFETVSTLSFTDKVTSPEVVYNTDPNHPSGRIVLLMPKHNFYDYCHLLNKPILEQQIEYAANLLTSIDQNLDNPEVTIPAIFEILGEGDISKILRIKGCHGVEEDHSNMSMELGFDILGEHYRHVKKPRVASRKPSIKQGPRSSSKLSDEVYDLIDWMETQERSMFITLNRDDIENLANEGIVVSKDGLDINGKKISYDDYMKLTMSDPDQVDEYGNYIPLTSGEINKKTRELAKEFGVDSSYISEGFMHITSIHMAKINQAYDESPPPEGSILILDLERLKLKMLHSGEMP